MTSLLPPVHKFNVLDRHEKIQRNYLLEASAGTGKTFSIENIVVRLLLEEPKISSEDVSLDKILVVTFTKAATRDLKIRIRGNIENCLAYLKSANGFEDILKSSMPDYLISIVQNGVEAVHQAKRKLEHALFSFDQAQIFTIHSFCSRMLREHALEGNINVDSIQGEQQMMNTEVLKVIRDFFRSEITRDKYTPEQIQIVLKKYYQKIEKLEDALLKILSRGVKIEEPESLTDLLIRFNRVMKELKSIYRLDPNKILEDFEKQVDLYKKQGDRKEANTRVEKFGILLEKEEWDLADLDFLIKDNLYLVKTLDPDNLKAKKKELPPEALHYPNLVPFLRRELKPIIERARSETLIFAQMAFDCQKLLENYMQEEEKLRFDDFLRLMDDALQNAIFANKVRARFKAAIIDEFQDTDPIQWRIFHTLFLNEVDSWGYLYLVGDPKQSIYAFRQADIYTYLSAAKAIGETNHASLDTNFRSSPSLVRALNTLFLSSPGLIDLPRIEQVLNYPEVKASSSFVEKRFSDSLGAVHFCLAEATEKSRSFPDETLETHFIFPFIVQEIMRLHEKDLIGFGKFAILVRDHRQGERIALFLREHRLPVSVQRSSSLSDSIAIAAMRELLHAVLQPRDESLLKTALGGVILGWNDLAIRSLDDHIVLETTLNSFYHLRKTLIQEGFSAFFTLLMETTWHPHEQCVRDVLLSQESGIDLYQELLQLADLMIEHQNSIHSSVEGLIDFLDDFARMEKDDDERIKKRQDPNQEGVHILTIHSSKGLEYEIVFALGLINRTRPPDQMIPVPHGNHYILRPLIDKESDIYHKHCEEVDAEKIRQLYVAMTRAKHRLYLPVAVVPSFKSAEPGCASPMELFLARLGQEPIKRGDLYQRIAGYNGNLLCEFIDRQLDGSISYSKLKGSSCSSSFFDQSPILTLTPPAKVSVPGVPAYMHSYTTLAKHALIPQGLPKNGFPTPRDRNALDKTPFTLPAGSMTGILLHGILELLPSYQLTYEQILPFVRKQMEGTELYEWAQVICQMVYASLQILLNAGGETFSLAEIPLRNCYREIEFLYPFQKFPLIEEFEIASGFLKGVIDLVFEHKGKYYLLDWKSNWLGGSFECYQQEFLKKAMIENGYFLQAAVYREALKKYISILDKRPFEDVFGGIFYVFLRGVDLLEGSQNGVYFFKNEGEI